MHYTIFIFKTPVYTSGTYGLKDKSFSSFEAAEQALLEEFSEASDVRIYKHGEKDDPIKKGRLVGIYQHGKLINTPPTKSDESKTKIARLDKLVIPKGIGIETFHIVAVVLILIAAASVYFISLN